MPEERRTVTTPGGALTYLLTVKAVKNLNLRIRPDGAVWVSAPRRTPRGEADRFVAGRADWIRAHQARLQERRLAPLPEAPEKGAALPILAAGLARVWPLAEALGVQQPALRCRAMKSRWGSCHFTKRVVTLNTALAAVPAPLLDYVALHELIHLRHPDHGPGFHGALDRLMPDWKSRRRELRGYESMLRE